MRLRSCILFACMAFVPMVAMFSHKIPREWRVAVQRIARGEGLLAMPSPQVDRTTRLPVATEPEAAPGPDRRPAALPAIDDLATVRAGVEDKLRALGAVSFECGPMSGGALHRCSCRVPADRTGQLQRVFQSSNTDPAVALKNLLGQVQFWKHRLATLSDSADQPSAVHAAREDRLR